MAKPKIDELLRESALQPDMCRRLLESPDEVFQGFDLTEEEKDILRRPDQRLLPLLGAALGRQRESPTTAVMSVPLEETPGVAAAPPSAVEARMFPDTLMALTVVPCALSENGQFKGLTYVVWVNPLPEGVDPATLPVPAGAALPGQPLAPLHAMIRISAMQSRDAAGNFQVGVWGSFRQPTDASLPPPPESSGELTSSPFKSPIESPQVKAAVAAVRQASSSEKYGRLVDLLHILHPGDLR
ncbi:MAG: hypothetical protein ACLQVL_32125 [Terriglobia bacterium]